jgi:hypothetical protein
VEKDQMTTNDWMMRPKDRLADCYAKQDIPFEADTALITVRKEQAGPGD